MITKRIIFYDGGCPMCNRMVLWLLKRDLKVEMFFAPLEGNTSAKVLAKDYQELIEMDTVVFKDKEEIYVLSEAAIQALLYTRYYAWLGYALKIFPLQFRDKAYVWIAKRRKQIWTSCPLIPAEYHRRFLN